MTTTVTETHWRVRLARLVRGYWAEAFGAAFYLALGLSSAWTAAAMQTGSAGDLCLFMRKLFVPMMLCLFVLVAVITAAKNVREV